MIGTRIHEIGSGHKARIISEPILSECSESEEVLWNYDHEVVIQMERSGWLDKIELSDLIEHWIAISENE